MLAVVVVSFGSADLLAQNLVPLGLQGRDVHVVVVDNLRTPQSQHAVEELGLEQGWEVLAHRSNAGFGVGANLGIARAVERGCDTVALLNPDLRLDVDALLALGEEARRHPRRLVAPRIVRPDGRVWFTGGSLDVRFGRTRNVELEGPAREGWLTGACLAFRTSLWADIHGFDADYFLYWEDVDLSLRCLRAGGDLVVRQDLLAVHDVGGTQIATGVAKSSTYYYYNCRNRLLFAAKHLPRKDVIRWLLLSPGFAKDVLLRGGRRQLLRTPRPVFDVARGTFAGAVHAVRALARRRTD